VSESLLQPGCEELGWADLLTYLLQLACPICSKAAGRMSPYYSPASRPTEDALLVLLPICNNSRVLIPKLCCCCWSKKCRRGLIW
jgi:hypothetical protein